MRALVVVESMFGNTMAVADAIAAGLRDAPPRTMEVDLHRVDHAPVRLADDVGLLVVGGPTHAFGMSRASTRSSAAEQSGSPTTTGLARGMREWLDELEEPERVVFATTFDTRVERPRVPGSAARRAEKHLRHMGFRIVHAATTFWVTGTAGPFADGELERARLHGLELGRRAAGPGRHPGASGRWPVAS
ncbi:flavodoxin family protein [Actinomarinicola tropica]|uniref:Flavodoxin-like domain-containing protein n=1 Tax=Actinomarinicola tropica TaxID=2789776 RepID=A0A5Q2RFI0_9ACTN|nr:flavodoxin family protein [Actinomarinicola tropica]QGG94453.1 hypothetical protein GH723_04670 [Actinomarinicola tropica]